MATIAVIGAGVVGLTTAIRLREAQHDVTIFADRRTPHVTSNRAGAVYTPFRAAGDERTRRWTGAAYETLCRLARDGPPDCGVSMTVLREYAFTRGEAAPWWAGCVGGFRELSPPPGYAAVYEALVPRMRMNRYLAWLEHRFVAELGGTIASQHVASLHEGWFPRFSIVVNCAGLGARELARDECVRPLRGQVLHVPNVDRLADCVVEEGRGDVTTYVFPFDDYIVLGGTYERDEWREATDESALWAIVERCRNLLRVDGQAGWQRIGDARIRAVAGLRPARVLGEVDENVRLEAEPAGEGCWVLHNYGHGRAGVTFAWACADDVVALAHSLLSRAGPA